ncbi:MAG TPA: homoserine O-acetyltransferase [Hyphomicrobiaceae bacterium]|nr:homoserine O-acetyltransferase [Hyphomicrobiaceae bacterium]
MKKTIAAVMALLLVAAAPVSAQDLMTKKEVFSIASFTTQSGRTLKDVKVGWESYGTLNADKSNAILICHFFSGNSHAAGKYSADEKAAGYWDAIIGPGKAIDTNKYFVLSSDTLVNLNMDPNTTTTGPASINPDTGKPYGMDFPIVSFRDFIEVQKQLVESLGIKKLVMVGGASMGALQAYEWASTYPDMVGKLMPVIAAGTADAGLIGWLDIWASPIRLDPKWNNGDYYGKEPPLAGLTQSLKIVTMHANHFDWANATFQSKWAKEGEDPQKSHAAKYAVEGVLEAAGAARAKVSDANHFLYLVKANQQFAAADSTARLSKIKAPTLLIYSPKDMVFMGDYVKKTAEALKAGGTKVETVELQGNRGHLDGVLSIKQAEKAISDFLAK